MQLPWAITLQIFWAKPGNPREGGKGGWGREPERSRVIRWPIRDMRYIFSCISNVFNEFHVNSCVIFAISTFTHACFSHHSQWNNWIIWNQDETADVNQVKTMKSRKLRCKSSGKLWFKWKTISTAVETFPPRWKHFHRGGNNYHRGGNNFHRGGNISTAV